MAVRTFGSTLESTCPGWSDNSTSGAAASGSTVVVPVPAPGAASSTALIFAGSVSSVSSLPVPAGAEEVIVVLLSELVILLY